MSGPKRFSITVLATVLFATCPAWAGVGADKAATLGGPDLTPTGAERAGNAAGTIPAWDGGLTTVPASYKGPGSRYVSPFPNDKPEFVITSKNVDQYKDQLTQGAIALFERYPDTYTMPVYKTRRTLALPQWVYDKMKSNAASATLVADGEGISDACGGSPFPFPKATSNPAKAIMWNHKLRYRGQTNGTHLSSTASSRGGNFSDGRLLKTVKFVYNQKDCDPVKVTKDNIALYFLQLVEDPARKAGGILLVHDTLNQVKGPRRAWRYNPGQRRIRRAPNVAYDNPSINFPGGFRLNDMLDGFNGATDRYNWQILSKKEMYVPYNDYRLHNASTDKMFGNKHLNQDLTRYELHRVWVVEGKVKQGTSHVVARRRFYVDEDSWQVVAVDGWDTRGELFYYQEEFPIIAYDQPLMQVALETLYDLSARRYIAANYNNGNQETDYQLQRADGYFTPRNVVREAMK